MVLVMFNLNNLGALNGLAIKSSGVLVFGSLLICSYTYTSRERIGATCEDGWQSYSIGSGTCSHHGGVETWEYRYWFDK